LENLPKERAKFVSDCASPPTIAHRGTSYTGGVLVESSNPQKCRETDSFNIPLRYAPKKNVLSSLFGGALNLDKDVFTSASKERAKFVSWG